MLGKVYLFCQDWGSHEWPRGFYLVRILHYDGDNLFVGEDVVTRAKSRLPLSCLGFTPFADMEIVAWLS